MARTQTMVQLTDELLADLDEEARRRGVSRSAVIRDAVHEHLRATRAARVGRSIAEGYRRLPPTTPDGWGDLEGLLEEGTVDVLRRLDQEERDQGHPPW
jgi:Arc/MetJ-type ribon-helix-helix transcriptional regulator